MGYRNSEKNALDQAKSDLGNRPLTGDPRVESQASRGKRNML